MDDEITIKTKRGNWPPRGFTPMEGPYRLTADWVLVLPQPFCRRVENGSLVLWRPGVTMWLDVFGNDVGASQVERLEQLRAGVSPQSHDVKVETREDCTWLTYRLRDESDDGPQESFSAFVIADTTHLMTAVYFDEPGDEAMARELVGSIRLSPVPEPNRS